MGLAKAPRTVMQTPAYLAALADWEPVGDSASIQSAIKEYFWNAWEIALDPRMSSWD